MAERAADRVTRLIGMVAHLNSVGEATLDDLAQRFGVTREQVLADVDTLWLTGTPGYQPDDLIDFDALSLDVGMVRLTQSRGLTRPLRLGGREAIALIAAMRALSHDLGPALDDDRRTVIASALTKLTTAAGALAGVSAPVDVRLGGTGQPQTAATVSAALVAGRRLRLRYVNAEDRTSLREVDPIRLVTDDQASYLVAWCLAADAERLFRLDRVLAATVLDTPADAHEVTEQFDLFAPEGDLVTLRLRSRARWIAETTPVVEVRNLDDGTFEVDLRIASSAWLQQLLLSTADEVRAVSPVSVARMVATTARSALTAYGEGPS